MKNEADNPLLSTSENSNDGALTLPTDPIRASSEAERSESVMISASMFVLLILLSTVNNVMISIAREMSRIPAFQRSWRLLDMNIVARLLGEQAMYSVVILTVSIFAIFIAARVLKGKGEFVSHVYALVIAWLKTQAVLLGIGFIALLIPDLYWVSLLVSFIGLHWVNQAIAKAHDVSGSRAFGILLLSMFFAFVASIVVGAAILSLVLTRK
jgi:hypothetical protein